MNDNLAGQLWFGAECLAAGSSIMNKESESESMRPLAKAVTKSLEKVRQLLREQCLSPQPEYTESIRENLKIFDRLFVIGVSKVNRTSNVSNVMCHLMS